MTAGLLIVLAGMIATRERKGARWCEKNGVGARRRIIAGMSPRVVTIGGETSPEAEAQSAAAQLLADECRKCRGCRLGRG